MRATLEEKINRLRAAEKRLRKHLSEDDFGVVRRTAEGFGQEADWLEELKRYRDLEKQGRLLVLPCKVGDTVYEIIEETVPNRYFYINEWQVQDVSAKAVKYADEWESYDYENLYFTREEAEAAERRAAAREKRQEQKMNIKDYQKGRNDGGGRKHAKR